MAFAAVATSSGDGGGGRPNLPGIPGYIERVPAERIWKTRCNSEITYVRSRTANPPKGRESFGALHGFEIIKHPTYTDVRRLPPSPAGSAVSRSRSCADGYSDAGGSRTLGRHASDLRAPTPSRPEPPAAPLSMALPTTNFVMPKYRNYSTEHMFEHESNPHASRTGVNLKRVLSVPAAVGRHI